MIHKDRLSLLATSSTYSSYLINIIPKYIFNINSRNILIIHFNHFHIREFFFFLYYHFNTQLKMFIDLATADFIACKRRFLNVYNLLSLNLNSRVFCKVWISKYIRIESLTFLYTNISWYERESWDMFGIIYLNHPDLRRILTDYGFRGYPLRKDFPLAGFVELKYDSITKRISYSPISLVQEFRSFKVDSQWHFFS